MRYNLNQILVSLALVIFSWSAIAAGNEELYAVQKVTVDGTELYLNGMGVVRKLNTDYYIAALYLKETSKVDTDIIFYETPKRLKLRFAIDRASARSFGRELAGGLKINNVEDELEAYRNDLRKLIGFFKGVYTKGDTITFDYVPKKGVSVRHNNRLLGRVSTRGFDKILFKAWLGDKPLSQSFKRGLVGANDDKVAIDLLRKYVALKQ